MDGLFEATELVVSAGDEPRMSAALLADRLGIARRQTMMRLIERNDAALRRFGEYLATVAKYSGRGRGQPEKDYLTTCRRCVLTLICCSRICTGNAPKASRWSRSAGASGREKTIITTPIKAANMLSPNQTRRWKC
ncbi:hypothetical protein [Rhodobacter capsulatus]|uniref:Uncharacterized protein n=1 Tax=Rhodobacter capsulatus (strain ATCC BAA-309 / NBRC 16581 / SB1003) TaxID=272942 RepID=D5APT3_RHOCB|nr:hypothetical protein [Rhodobacter capsulatus]ADE86652.1 hypothetical protein RCAP_rcc02925 [Rhodobacter capsulatus SB 1003]MDS0928452.1 hypothetical protein [Rhodobacter capsulatus]TQD33050.1 hypothetical protein FKW81_16535 [Rhodobacter capsulatus]